MQYMKRLVQKIYENYQTHDANNRFFPDKLLQASMLCRVIEEIKYNRKTDPEHLKRLYYAMHRYWTIPIIQTRKNVKRSDFKEEKDYNKQKKQYFKQARVQPMTVLRKLLDKEVEVINRFLVSVKNVETKEEMPVIMSHIPGVIGVIYPGGFTYEKQPRRGMMI